MLAAIQDEGRKSMTSEAYKALLTIGAKEPMKRDYRGSFALIGFSGNIKPGFVKQVSQSGSKVLLDSPKLRRGYTQAVPGSRPFPIAVVALICIENVYTGTGIPCMRAYASTAADYI